MKPGVSFAISRLGLLILRHGEWFIAVIGVATFVAFGAVGVAVFVAGLVLTFAALWISPVGRLHIMAYLAMRRRPLRRHKTTINTGVSAPVEVHFDEHALPCIRAQTEADAWHAAGVVMASERMFQMDMARRRGSAQLAELLGKGALESDLNMCSLGLASAAGALLNRIDPTERALLQAFSDGVNACLNHPSTPLPFEYHMLGCRPTPWQPRDSLAILIGLHMALSEGPEAARMRQIMDQTLAPEVTAFLFGAAPIPPLDALAAIIANRPADAPPAIVGPPPAGAASNAAALPGGAMRDGKAALINDLHLPLTVPGPVYMLRIELPDQKLTGALFPGLPVLVAGQSNNIAFGITSLSATTCRAEPRQAQATQHAMMIKVRDGEPQESDLWLDEGWPVPDGPDGRWRLRLNILQPGGIDLKLGAVLRAGSVEEALARAEASAAPPLEVVAIDSAQRAGRGITKIKDAPREVKEANATQLIVTANGPHPLAENPSHPSRGDRIKTLLQASTPLDSETIEASARDLCLPVLETWHSLALEAAPQAGISAHDHALLKQWCKTADPNERATAWIAAFAEEAAARTLGPYLWSCRTEQPDFVLRLNDLDSPALAIIAARPDPVPGEFTDWTTLLGDALLAARANLKARYGRHDPLWSAVNAPCPAHPLADALPFFGAALRWPSGPVPGAEGAVWRTAPENGIALRLIVHGGPSGRFSYLTPPGLTAWPLDPAAQSQMHGWRKGHAIGIGRAGAGGRMTLVPEKCRV